MLRLQNQTNEWHDPVLYRASGAKAAWSGGTTTPRERQKFAIFICYSGILVVNMIGFYQL